MRRLEMMVPEHAVRMIGGKGCAMAWRRLFTDGKKTAALTGSRELPYTEQIWFPYHIYTLEMTSRRNPGLMQVSVEAWSGAFAIFQLGGELIDSPPEKGEVFAPRLHLEDCESHARDNLLHTIMRQRSRLGGKPVAGAVVERETILYPLWVYYFARKKGVIDIKIVDGISGRPSGHRTRTGVLDAFVAKQKAPGGEG
tara:strand:+ start:41 stop:631 length:591 start_codon:yes stop_codon:yes gene_type:complete